MKLRERDRGVRTYPGGHGVRVGTAMMKVKHKNREDHRQRTHRHDARKVDSCHTTTAVLVINAQIIHGSAFKMGQMATALYQKGAKYFIRNT